MMKLMRGKFRDAIYLLLFAVVYAAVMGRAAAYPITNTNGDITMTIYGAKWDGSMLVVDIGAPNGYLGSIDIVSTDGTAYKQNIEYGGIGGPGWGKDRYIAVFDVPPGTNIDRMDVTPEGVQGGPAFSIDWNSDHTIKVDTTAIQIESVTGSKYQTGYKAISLNLKVKNTADSELDLSKEDFNLIDQDAWVYDRNNIVNDDPVLVVPPNGEKTVTLKFSSILETSKPMQLSYKGASVNIFDLCGQAIH